MLNDFDDDDDVVDVDGVADDDDDDTDCGGNGGLGRFQPLKLETFAGRSCGRTVQTGDGFVEFTVPTPTVVLVVIGFAGSGSIISI